MLSNFEILRKNKIVALVVMFLVLGVVVWVLDMIHGYSLFETFITADEVALLCHGNKLGTDKCKEALKKSLN
jgi:hypothetical protein